MNHKITKTELLFDLYYAFQCAKIHKSSKDYIIEFEKNLQENLMSLCDEIYSRKYVPRPSVCFIIDDPKRREVFAANFRDRIVHHLYYNYTYEIFNRTFIEDSYSCRIGKGIHYGVKRLEYHIKSESQTYSIDTYALKMDIKGYFIHINRKRLLSIVMKTLDSMRDRTLLEDNTVSYSEVYDFDLISYLSREIILLDPTLDCILKSEDCEWLYLDESKSLFCSEEGCGLPIGNLTSQLFSNVYLNVFDQFMKRILKCKHYGRYVDDFYVISSNKDFLTSIIPEVEEFMKNTLSLEIQPKKTVVVNIEKGVEFLGAFVKPFRTYLSNKTLRRIRKHLHEFQNQDISKLLANSVVSMVNSYIGVFSHYKSFNLKKDLFINTPRLYEFGDFIECFEKFVGKEN